MAKKVVKDLFPLVHRQLSAENALMLCMSGIVYEPVGSKVFDAMKSLEKAKYDKRQVSKLTKGLEPWQIERIREGLDARKRWFGRAKRVNESVNRDLDIITRGLNESDLKLPVKFITMTERCNRHCLHCMVSADMKGTVMPFSDLERYLNGLVRLSPDMVMTGAGEQFLYDDNGKDLGDVVKLMLERCKYAFIRIVTSGIEIGNGNSPWARAAHKLANLSEMDKERVSLSLSVRSFANRRMKAASETLKFFIENGMRVFPNLEGITCHKGDDGKFHGSLEERAMMVNDLLASFGIGRLEQIRTSVGCDPVFAYMGNTVANYGIIIDNIKKYFGKDKAGKIIIRSWDDCRGSLGDACKRKWFGLMPDGTVTPGCCSYSFPFMRFGSMKGARQEGRNRLVSQMLNDRNQFIAAQSGWEKKESCIPCIDWFIKMGKKTNGRMGIRDAERFKSLLPTHEDIKRLNFQCRGKVIRQSRNPFAKSVKKQWTNKAT